MELAALISKRNLELAWRRIVTARNLQHKRFFRHLYGGYELGLKVLPSIVESANRRDDEPELDPSDAERIMREALKGKPLKVVDKTRLRYVLLSSLAYEQSPEEVVRSPAPPPGAY